MTLFYRIESLNSDQVMNFVRQYCADRYICSSRDGYIFVYSSFELENMAQRRNLPDLADTLAGFRCGLGDPRLLVDEDKDPELKRWIQDIKNRVRENSKRGLLGQGR